MLSLNATGGSRGALAPFVTTPWPYLPLCRNDNTKANHVVSYTLPLQSNFSGGGECSEMPSQHVIWEPISSLVS